MVQITPAIISELVGLYIDVKTHTAAYNEYVGLVSEWNGVSKTVLRALASAGTANTDNKKYAQLQLDIGHYSALLPVLSGATVTLPNPVG